MISLCHGLIKKRRKIIRVSQNLSDLNQPLLQFDSWAQMDEFFLEVHDFELLSV